MPDKAEDCPCPKIIRGGHALKALNSISKVTDKICYFVSIFSMIVTVLMTVVLMADVLLRKITAIPIFPSVVSIKGAYEIVQMSLCCFVFSTWGYTQSVHGHINVIMFIQKFHPIPRFICYAFTSLLSVVTMAFGTVAAFQQIPAVYETGEATANLLIPYWPFYVFEFIAMLLLVVTLLIDALKAVVAIWNKDMAAEIQSEWV